MQKWNETKLIKLIRNTHMTKLLPTYERAFLCGALTRKQIKVLMMTMSKVLDIELL